MGDQMCFAAGQGCRDGACQEGREDDVLAAGDQERRHAEVLQFRDGPAGGAAQALRAPSPCRARPPWCRCWHREGAGRASAPPLPCPSPDGCRWRGRRRSSLRRPSPTHRRRRRPTDRSRGDRACRRSSSAPAPSPSPDGRWRIRASSSRPSTGRPGARRGISGDRSGQRGRRRSRRDRGRRRSRWTARSRDGRSSRRCSAARSARPAATSSGDCRPGRGRTAAPVRCPTPRSRGRRTAASIGRRCAPAPCRSWSQKSSQKRTSVEPTTPNGQRPAANRRNLLSNGEAASSARRASAS